MLEVMLELQCTYTSCPLASGGWQLQTSMNSSHSAAAATLSNTPAVCWPAHPPTAKLLSEHIHGRGGSLQLRSTASLQSE